MSIAIRSEGKKINSAINVTPMVDVMLVLLIIFMVITPLLKPGVPLNLATTASAIEMRNASEPDALIVSVVRDGTIFLNNEIVSSQALTEKVRDRLSNQTNKTVYVRADAHARYGSLVDAVDSVRSAGVDQLGLLTDQKPRVIQ